MVNPLTVEPEAPLLRDTIPFVIVPPDPTILSFLLKVKFLDEKSPLKIIVSPALTEEETKSPLLAKY